MNERFGFIHDKLDIKLLILYILRHLPAEIDAEKLADLVLIDGGISYFDYKVCLAELVNTALVTEEDGCYQVTAKGSRNCEVLENTLPYSVRTKARSVMAPVIDEMRRSAMILANHEVTKSGVMVYLAMDDELGSVFDLKILVADEQQAKKIEKSFKKNAESFYQRFVCELLE